MPDPIEEQEEEPYDYRPPPGPSPRKVRRRWAEDGDVDALWKLLARSRWCDIDREDIFKLMIQALEVQSRADPARFASEVMGRMTVFVTTLLMRSHLHLAACVEQDGRAVRRLARPPGDLPRLAVEALIPRLVQLQEHLASLLVAQSSIARQWSLVRKNEAKGDREGVAKPRRKADRKREAKVGNEGVAKPRRKAGKEEMRTAPDRPSAPIPTGTPTTASPTCSMAMVGGPMVITVGSKPTVRAPEFAQERRWDAVEMKLVAHAERLADQGGLVAMKSASGRRVWVVRFADIVDGRRVHRSVYVGGDDQPELLARTRRWLDHCRVRGRVADDVAGCARLAVAACGAVRRLHTSLVPRRR